MIETRYFQVVEEVTTAAEMFNNPNVRLIAVSKTVPAADIAKVYQLGQRCFGESKAGELAAKAEALPKDIQWHFIGHLQSNKVRQVIKYAEWIHSVDSEKLLARINQIAGEIARRVNVLIEVNVSEETSKYGLSLEEASALCREQNLYENIRIAGLMTMAPENATEHEQKHIFNKLRRLGDELDLPELSMGMSGDFRCAIACGSTLVRIGSAIFGERDYAVNK